MLFVFSDNSISVLRLSQLNDFYSSIKTNHDGCGSSLYFHNYCWDCHSLVRRYVYCIKTYVIETPIVRIDKFNISLYNRHQ